MQIEQSVQSKAKSETSRIQKKTQNEAFGQALHRGEYVQTTVPFKWSSEKHWTVISETKKGEDSSH